MVITYTKNYTETFKGPDWVMHSCHTFKSTKIIFELVAVVHSLQSQPFEKIGPLLKEAYKNRKAKSRCDIMVEKETIEVTVRGVFPVFYINRQNPTA